MEKKRLAVLGNKNPEKVYPERVGVYALPVTFNPATNSYLIAVAGVKKPHKETIDYHLFGGAEEPDDAGNHLSTLERELREEAGCSIEVSQEDYIHRIDEYVEAKTLECEKIGYYYYVKIIEQVQEPIESNHTIVVMPIEEALKKLHHPSARMIVWYYMKMKGILDLAE
ncbi:MAG: NUDIX domain-containing protein [Candidatus Gracilibacteria bacterium]